MKKQYFFLISVIFLVLLVSQVSAFFTDEHTTWTAEDVLYGSGIISSTCSDRVQIVVDGNFAADQFVIHYFDGSKVGSYISTHTRGSGYDRCLEWAGADTDLICFCYGLGYHNVQDHFSHTYLDNGDYALTPYYLSSRFSANAIGHMTVEDSYDTQFLKYKASDTFVSNGLEKQYTAALLDTTLFVGNDVEKGTYNKYVSLLTRMTGLSPEQVLKDANLITNGYKGVGFYNTVYKDKQTIPDNVQPYIWLLITVPLVLLFGLMYIPWLLRKNMTKWRFILYLLLILISVLGAMIMLSFYLQNTWQLIRLAVRMLPIQVSSADIAKYDTLAKTASVNFNNDVILTTEDNTGLSYYDSSGTYHQGALGQSELPFYYGIVPLLIVFLSLLLIWLIFKTFKTTPIKNRALQLFNVIGYSIFFITILVIIYMLFNLIVFK